MIYRDPYVKLIGVIDARKEAWITSRPGFNHDDFDISKIGVMDLSLNSMKMYHLEIGSSVLFRDIMLSLRPIFPWARSVRSAPITLENLDISSEIAWGFEDIIYTINTIKSGVQQDIARRYLPISLYTVFSVLIDHRTLVGFIKAIESLGNDRIKIYSNLLSKIVPEYDLSSIKDLSKNYLISNSEIESEGTHKIGNMLFGNFSIKYALASQFIRQHQSKIKSGMWNGMPFYGEYKRTQDDIVDVVFYSDIESYDNTMRLRSHWFADWSPGMWEDIVYDYIKDMSIEEFWDFIPNGNGKKDPYYRDMLSRVNGEEHNLPCPIMCECPSFIYEREEKYGKSKIIDKYKELHKFGFIKDNPNNELRLKYESISK